MAESRVEVRLADVVRTIRAEFASAAAQPTGSSPFEVVSIEVELAVELRLSTGSGVGWQAWVVAADDAGPAPDATRHRVTLTLQPGNR